MRFEAKLFDELEPCYPDMTLEDGVGCYRVDCCNGMYAGVNIVMDKLTVGKPIMITVHGPHSGYKLFKMLPVPVEVNTGAKLRTEYLKNDFNEHVIRRAPFMVYDALKPIYNTFVTDSTCCALNFKSIVEYNRQNKEESWSITIEHNNHKVLLVLDVGIYQQTLPKPNEVNYKYINWINYENIAKYHNLQMWTDDYFSMLRKYIRTAVYSRQNMLNIPIESFISKVGDDIKLDTELLSRVINMAKECGIKYFQGSALTKRYYEAVDDDEFYNSLDHDAILHTDMVAKLYGLEAMKAFDHGDKALTITGEPYPSEKGERDLRILGQLMSQYIEAADLKNVYIQCALDEPNDLLAKAYKGITDIIKDTMPGTKIMEPVLETDKIVGTLDIWCPSVDIYEKNKAFYDQQKANGDGIFVYTCLTPGGNYLNRLLDMERIRCVLLGWAPALYKDIEGFLHWGANQYLDVNPYERQSVMFSEQVLEFHPKKASFLPAGDYCIFYPGFHEPYISIRSEAHRIGLEDLCLLQMLDNLDADKKQKIMGKIFRSYSDYEKSIEIYREARRELLSSVHSAVMTKHNKQVEVTENA